MTKPSSTSSADPSAAARSGAVKIGLVTVSDRASQGVYEDKGGPAMLAWSFNRDGEAMPAMIERRDRTVLRMGYDSLAVVVVYLGGVTVLYQLR